MALTLEERVSRLEGLTDGLRDQLNQIHRDLKAFEERVDRRFEAMEHRFEIIERRFEAMEHRFEAIERRFEAFDRRFFWIFGLLFTSWLSLMMAILFK